MSKATKKVSPYFVKPKITKQAASPIKIQFDRDNPPENWSELYNNIVTMRQDASAPVDSMGCERAHDMEAAPPVQRFQCQDGPGLRLRYHSSEVPGEFDYLGSPH